MTSNKLPNYFAYLVRLWRADDQSVWHATLQDPHTGAQFRFETIESLYLFIQQQLGMSPVPDTLPPPDLPKIEQKFA
jgi:hypothetical protein